MNTKREDETVVDAIIAGYCKDFELLEMKTVELGSAYRICWEISLDEKANKRFLLDSIRAVSGRIRAFQLLY